jgi:hypothetical protein
MDPITPIHHAADPYVSRAGSSGAARPETAGAPADSVHLSPAAQREVLQTGRIALNLRAGTITDDQAKELTGQLASIHGQIVSGGDPQAIAQLQDDLSGQIYGDAHGGAPLPAGPAPEYALRQAYLGGRIALNEKAGNLTRAEAGTLFSQVDSIRQQIAAGKQANGGTLSPEDAQVISQLQDQLSRQIHDLAHDAPAQ